MVDRQNQLIVRQPSAQPVQYAKTSLLNPGGSPLESPFMGGGAPFGGGGGNFLGGGPLGGGFGGGFGGGGFGGGNIGGGSQLVPTQGAGAGAGGSSGSGFSLTDLKGMIDRFGGIDGIVTTMGKVQKIVQSLQQMSPMIKLLFGSFLKRKGGAATAAAPRSAKRRRKRKPTARTAQSRKKRAKISRTHNL